MSVGETTLTGVSLPPLTDPQPPATEVRSSVADSPSPQERLTAGQPAAFASMTGDKVFISGLTVMSFLPQDLTPKNSLGGISRADLILSRLNSLEGATSIVVETKIDGGRIDLCVSYKDKELKPQTLVLRSEQRTRDVSGQWAKMFNWAARTAFALGGQLSVNGLSLSFAVRAEGRAEILLKGVPAVVCSGRDQLFNAIELISKASVLRGEHVLSAKMLEDLSVEVSLNGMVLGKAPETSAKETIDLLVALKTTLGAESSLTGLWQLQRVQNCPFSAADGSLLLNGLEFAVIGEGVQNVLFNLKRAFSQVPVLKNPTVSFVLGQDLGSIDLVVNGIRVRTIKIEDSDEIRKWKEVLSPALGKNTAFDDTGLRQLEKLNLYKVTAENALVMVNGAVVVRAGSAQEALEIAHNLKKMIIAIPRKPDGSLIPPSITVDFSEEGDSAALAVNGRVIRKLVLSKEGLADYKANLGGWMLQLAGAFETTVSQQAINHSIKKLEWMMRVEVRNGKLFLFDKEIISGSQAQLDTYRGRIRKAIAAMEPGSLPEIKSSLSVVDGEKLVLSVSLNGINLCNFELSRYRGGKVIWDDEVRRFCFRNVENMASNLSGAFALQGVRSNTSSSGLGIAQARIVEIGMKQVGLPYVWPSRTCSTLVSTLLPASYRGGSAVMRSTFVGSGFTRVRMNGNAISSSSISPGDVVVPFLIADRASKVHDEIRPAGATTHVALSICLAVEGSSALMLTFENSGGGGVQVRLSRQVFRGIPSGQHGECYILPESVFNDPLYRI